MPRSANLNFENVGSDFLPKYETARVAVERARQRVRENNEMISKIKSESNIRDSNEDQNPSLEAEIFSIEDSYAFDLYKIKSTNGINNFIRDLFGMR